MAEPGEARAPLNFKSSVQKDKKEVTIKTVQLAGSVAMKILQHCSEADNTGATGQLLGLDVASTLEVTECFPSLVRTQLLSGPAVESGRRGRRGLAASLPSPRAQCPW